MKQITKKQYLVITMFGSFTLNVSSRKEAIEQGKRTAELSGDRVVSVQWVH